MAFLFHLAKILYGMDANKPDFIVCRLPGSTERRVICVCAFEHIHVGNVWTKSCECVRRERKGREEKPPARRRHQNCIPIAEGKMDFLADVVFFVICWINVEQWTARVDYTNPKPLLCGRCPKKRAERQDLPRRQLPLFHFYGNISSRANSSPF